MFIDDVIGKCTIIERMYEGIFLVILCTSQERVPDHD